MALTMRDMISGSYSVISSRFSGIANSRLPPASRARLARDGARERFLGNRAGEDWKKVDDILAGVHAAIAARTVALVRRVGANAEVTFTGGVSRNVGMRRAIITWTIVFAGLALVAIGVVVYGAKTSSTVAIGPRLPGIASTSCICGKSTFQGCGGT